VVVPLTAAAEYSSTDRLRLVATRAWVVAVEAATGLRPAYGCKLCALPPRFGPCLRLRSRRARSLEYAHRKAAVLSWLAFVAIV